MNFLGGLSIRQSLYQVLSLLLTVSTALMLWKAASLYLDTESPIVVVLSESMEPEFHRGDLLFLSLPSSRFGAIEIPVFKLQQREIPIVHRAIRTHDKISDGTQFILTKGDNNDIDDRGLYPRHQNWITRGDFMGVVKGYMPNVGMMTIIMNDYPMVKYALIAVLGVFVLTTREQ